VAKGQIFERHGLVHNATALKLRTYWWREALIMRAAILAGVANGGLHLLVESATGVSSWGTIPVWMPRSWPSRSNLRGGGLHMGEMSVIHW